MFAGFGAKEKGGSLTPAPSTKFNQDLPEKFFEFLFEDFLCLKLGSFLYLSNLCRPFLRPTYMVT